MRLDKVNINSYKVWVVDDDEDDQLFISSAFKACTPPISVFALNDGSELLPCLAKCTTLPRLVLLDINMPRKNGFEVLQELRNTPEFANLPVVILTTSSAEAEQNRSFALGANQFITKPLSFDKLSALAQELSTRWVLS